MLKKVYSMDGIQLEDLSQYIKIHDLHNALEVIAYLNYYHI